LPWIGGLPNTECITATIKDVPDDVAKPVKGSVKGFNILIGDRSGNEKEYMLA
jgi:hypothetical protein